MLLPSRNFPLCNSLSKSDSYPIKQISQQTVVIFRCSKNHHSTDVIPIIVGFRLAIVRIQFSPSVDFVAYNKCIHSRPVSFRLTSICTITLEIAPTTGECNRPINSSLTHFYPARAYSFTRDHTLPLPQGQHTLSNRLHH